jgi:hypothetical protein
MVCKVHSPRDVAERLAALPHLGDGLVFQICREVQREHWEPPGRLGAQRPADAQVHGEGGYTGLAGGARGWLLRLREERLLRFLDLLPSVEATDGSLR